MEVSKTLKKSYANAGSTRIGAVVKINNLKLKEFEAREKSWKLESEKRSLRLNSEKTNIQRNSLLAKLSMKNPLQLNLTR